MNIIHFTDVNKDIINYIINKNKYDDYYEDMSEERKSMLALMHKAFYFLSDSEKSLLKMRYIECLGIKEIAKHFQQTPQNISYKINKIMNVDLPHIIDSILLDYKNELSSEDAQIFELSNCYRFSAKKISEILKKDVRTIQKRIQIVNIKLKIATIKP